MSNKKKSMIASENSETLAREQKYFWTPEWQAKEKEADEAIANGRVKTFATIDDLLQFLDNQENN